MHNQFYDFIEKLKPKYQPKKNFYGTCMSVSHIQLEIFNFKKEFQNNISVYLMENSRIHIHKHYNSNSDYIRKKFNSLLQRSMKLKINTNSYRNADDCIINITKENSKIVLQELSKFFDVTQQEVIIELERLLLMSI